MNTKSEIDFSRENCIELGPVLSVVKQKHINSSLAVIGPLVGIMLMGAFVYCAGTVVSDPPLWMEATLCLLTVLVFVCLLGGTIVMTSRFGGERVLYIHEYGIRFLKPGKETKIPYSQLRQFSFKKTKMYQEMYQGKNLYGINFELEFKSSSAHRIIWRGHNSITRRESYWYGISDAIDYDWVNHHLSRIVASSIATRMEMGEEIPWGNSAFIKKDGLEIKKITGLLASRMIFVPWLDLKDLQFHDGKLSISVSKPQPWHISMNCDEVNILPGYLLIKTLLKSQTSNTSLGHQSESEISSAIASEYAISYRTPMAG